MSHDINKIIDGALQMATAELQKNAQMPSFITLVSANGTAETHKVPDLALNDESLSFMKDLFAVFLRLRARQIDAQVAIHVANAWLVKKNGPVPESIDTLPRDDPERKDALVIVVEVRDQSPVMITSLYHIDDGKVVIDETEHHGNGWEAKGRFVNILKEAFSS